MKSKTKFIFVLGGVMSGLGKGISASSIGYLLKSAGLRVNILKLDITGTIIWQKQFDNGGTYQDISEIFSKLSFVASYFL